MHRCLGSVIAGAAVAVIAAVPATSPAQAPQRIVSLAPSLTETLFAVGAGDRVVGVTRFCDYPPAATTRTQVGGALSKTISVEQILSLSPDMVFSLGVGQRELVASLQRLGVDVRVFTPVGVEDTFEMIEAVGEAVGLHRSAERLTTHIKTRMARIEAQLAEHATRAPPRVFFQVWDDALMPVGGDSYISELIQRAGGNALFAELEGDYVQISAEQVVRRDPQVVLAPMHHGERRSAESFVGRPGWDRLRAVRDGRVYLLDDDLISRNGPRIDAAFRRVALALYPQLATVVTPPASGLVQLEPYADDGT